ncbi:hypothetical protein ACIA8O_25600 [Kitasatospora sp. NPDC051853]|uniref:hypothetical protein n=1 Tax=Kitasatospora sp. NPDC051853 TaxID=3364058 RepID=UPI0037B9BC13
MAVRGCADPTEPDASFHTGGFGKGDRSFDSRPVKGCVFQKCRSVGEPGSALGCPTSAEYSTVQGVRPDVQRGHALWAYGVATP